MFRLLRVIAVLSVVVVVMATATPALAHGGDTEGDDTHIEKASLRIDRMFCSSCKQDVEGAINGTEGIVESDVFIGGATIEYDPTKVTPEDVVKAINRSGQYFAAVMTDFVRSVRLRVPELQTTDDGFKIGNALRGVEGFLGSTPKRGVFIIEYDSQLISPEGLVEEIYNRSGFTASVPSAGADGDTFDTATAVIKVEGMTDRAKAFRVEATITSLQITWLEGIVRDGVEVNTEDETLTVIFEPEMISAQDMLEEMQTFVPHHMELLSVTKPGSPLFTSPWFVISLVGLVVVAAFAWPTLRKRLQAASVGGTGDPMRPQ
ncbi:MAG: cation transporter [Chloroflexi bacterium]|nr:cation transporter [Chloroflexota bacterium]